MSHDVAKRNQHVLNPQTKTYEFLGPPGAFLVSTVTPFLSYAIAYACSEQQGGCPRSWSALPSLLVESITDKDWWKAQWDPEGVAVYFGWYAFCLASWWLLPGDWMEGLPLRTGGKIKYKINAFATLLLALGITGGIIWTQGPVGFTYLYNHYIGVLTGSVIMAIVQSILSYAFSFQEGKLLALGGNTGNVLYDWFIGRELNPHLGSFDLKTFNELRPGMILWLLLNISFACEQSIRRGGHHSSGPLTFDSLKTSLSSITDSMWLVQGFQALYIFDALYNEPSIFSTMDIASDGLGFMLIIGCITWIPFIFSIQARFLAWHPVELGTTWTVAIFLLHMLGYYIFRDSNGEKDDFRRGKNPKGLQWMQTKRGTKLLTSGWWGLSRHPNYLGDLIMGLSWCLPTGFSTPITYFYIMYFTVLLVHRQRRDDEACKRKYDDDWETYKQIVPWRIIPKIY